MAGEKIDNIVKMQYKEEELQLLEGFRLLDDDFMTVVFDRNIEATERLVRIVLGREDIRVLDVTAQREYKNPVTGGRSITIDIYACDADGKVYDIEVQRASKGADPHRARFHSSMVDTRMLKAGQEFKEIHDSYVIFITEKDELGGGFPLYHADRIVRETGQSFGDGSHIIYVNGSFQDDTHPVGRLAHDFRCTDASEMFYEKFARSVRYFKETEGGRKEMSEAMEKFYERRMLDERIDSARKMLADGRLEEEKIAEYSNLPLEKVKELAALQTV